MAKKDEYRRYNDVLRRLSGSAVRPYHEDGYVNMMTRYGTSKDVTEQYKFVPEAQIPDEMLTMHYESNGLFAKIIDAPAEEAIKHGFELEGISDQNINEFWKNGLDILDWEENAITAMKWARLFGGSIIVMLIDDGRGIDEPVDYSNIKSISDLVVYDRSVITPDYSSVYKYVSQDPSQYRGSRLGMPEYFYVFSRYGSFTVHESRCLIFRNGVLPENTTNSIYQMWGIPEYIRINKALRDAEVAHGSATKLLDRSVQPVYKMQDLSAELATEEGESRVLKRLEAIDMARGMLNSIVIDANGEDYDFRSFQFSGVSQVIDSTCNLLSAITSIPQTILFGRSPSGMNATGHGDMENYYNYVERNAQRMVKPNIRKLLNVLFRAGLYTGEVDEIPQINVKFNPLWNLTESEQLDIDMKRAQLESTRAGTANAYVGMQAIDPSEVRKKLADTGEFDVESMLDDLTEEEIENMPGQQGGGMEGMMGGGAPGGMPGMPGGTPGGGPGGAPAGPAPGGQEAQPQMQQPEQNSPKAPTNDETPEDNQTTTEDETAPTEENSEPTNPDEDEPEKQDSESLGSVGVIVVRDGKVLCGIRTDASLDHYIGGPGGYIEEGETPGYAAMRETEEEFGIVPNELVYLGNGPTENDTGLTPYVFLCTDFEGEPVCNDGKMANPSFIPLEDLEEMGDYLFEPFADSLNLLVASLINKDSREDADSDENWKTVNGTHVQINEEGQIITGPQALKDYSLKRRGRSQNTKNESSGGQAVSPETYKGWGKSLGDQSRGSLIEKAKSDPEFKEMVDAIVLYTEGAYVEQRKLAENIVNNGMSSVEDQTVADYISEDEMGAAYRNLWDGQDLAKSKSSMARGMMHIINTINDSEPHEGQLLRVAQDRRAEGIEDSDTVWVPPKPGDKIRIDAPTSFTSSAEVEEELSPQKSGDVIHYRLESGANALDISALSQYDQKEFLCCGEYEVVSIDTKVKGLSYVGDEATDAQKARGIVKNEDGDNCVELYDSTIVIRQTGKVGIGGHSDSDEPYADCSWHFDGRMVREQKMDGGPGSGNFGHSGREGEVGGSSKAKQAAEKLGKINARMNELTEENTKLFMAMADPNGNVKDLAAKVQKNLAEVKRLEEQAEELNPTSHSNFVRHMCELGHPTREQVLDSLPKEWADQVDADGGRMRDTFSAKIGAWCGDDYKSMKEDEVLDYGIRHSSMKWSDGDLYRGLTFPRDQLSNIQAGGTLQMQGISSWSSDVSVSLDFAKYDTNSDPVLVVDKTKGTRDALAIGQLSGYAFEKEVLYARDQGFKVKSVATKDFDVEREGKTRTRKVTVIEVEAEQN